MSSHLRQPSAPGDGRQNLLVRLEEAQHTHGYVPEWLLEELAQSLGIAVGEVYGVATFYSFLSTQPRGRYVIRVCKGLPCGLSQSSPIINAIEDAVGIKTGQTTPDGKFSLELTNCIGACDRAPAMLVNSELHTDLTPEAVPRILRAYV